MDVHTDGHQPPTPAPRTTTHRHTWKVIAVDKAQCQQCQLIVPIVAQEDPESPPG